MANPDPDSKQLADWRIPRASGSFQYLT